MTSAFLVMAMLIRAGREKCAVWEDEEQNNYKFQLEHSGEKKGWNAVLSVASSSSNSECMFASTGGIPRDGVEGKCHGQTVSSAVRCHR
jgi:hypothetical protein